MARLTAELASTVDLIARGIETDLMNELRTKLTAMAAVEIEAVCIAAAKNITARVEVAHRMQTGSMELCVAFGNSAEVVKVQR